MAPYLLQVVHVGQVYRLTNKNKQNNKLALIADNHENKQHAKKIELHHNIKAVQYPMIYPVLPLFISPDTFPFLDTCCFV